MSDNATEKGFEMSEGDCAMAGVIDSRLGVKMRDIFIQALKNAYLRGYLAATIDCTDKLRASNERMRTGV